MKRRSGLGLVRCLTLVVTSIQGLLKLIPSSDVTLLCHSANVNVTGQSDRVVFEYGRKWGNDISG